MYIMLYLKNSSVFATFYCNNIDKSLKLNPGWLKNGLYLKVVVKHAYVKCTGQIT
jgi:hypothetical protein